MSLTMTWSTMPALKLVAPREPPTPTCSESQPRLPADQRCHLTSAPPYEPGLFINESRPGWSGARFRPAGLGESGLRSPCSRAQEDHLVGAARWPRFEGRCHVGRRGFGLARWVGFVGAGS